MYKNENPLFWRAIIREDYQYLGKGNCYYLEISIKPLNFDNIRFSITAPDENIKYTDMLRANQGFAFITFFKKSYIVTDDKPELLQAIAAEILSDTHTVVANFLKNIRDKYGDLYHFIIENSDEEPVLAGLSYISLGKYQKAIECFDFADRENRYWNLVYGSLNRPFHKVCRDYCTTMLNGLSWCKEYVFQGIGR